MSDYQRIVYQGRPGLLYRNRCTGYCDLILDDPAPKRDAIGICGIAVNMVHRTEFQTFDEFRAGFQRDLAVQSPKFAWARLVITPFCGKELTALQGDLSRMEEYERNKGKAYADEFSGIIEKSYHGGAL